MGIATFPAPSAASKILKKITLTSGSSWTVPTGVTDINVLLVGGGGGSSGVRDGEIVGGTGIGNPGNTVWSTVTTTPGGSISYSIGAGGTGGTAASVPGNGGAGGTTTFTGATSATGGNGGIWGGTGSTGSVSFATNQGVSPVGAGTQRAGGAGGAGFIVIEYWV